MVTVTLHYDTSEDSLSACLELQLASHFKEKAASCLFRFLPIN